MSAMGGKRTLVRIEWGTTRARFQPAFQSCIDVPVLVGFFEDYDRKTSKPQNTQTARKTCKQMVISRLIDVEATSSDKQFKSDFQERLALAATCEHQPT